MLLSTSIIVHEQRLLGSGIPWLVPINVILKLRPQLLILYTIILSIINNLSILFVNISLILKDYLKNFIISFT